MSSDSKLVQCLHIDLKYLNENMSFFFGHGWSITICGSMTYALYKLQKNMMQNCNKNKTPGSSDWFLLMTMRRFGAKDNGGCAHPVTRKLGVLSKDNASRDFWRVLDKGPDPWLRPVSHFRGIEFVMLDHAHHQFWHMNLTHTAYLSKGLNNKTKLHYNYGSWTTLGITIQSTFQVWTISIAGWWGFP